MRHVQDHLERCQRDIAEHPFFACLREDGSLEKIQPVASAVTFWVMAFQDALRINVDLISDPDLKVFAERHRAGDLGHDRWFLHDLELVAGSLPDVRALFGPDHQVARDVSYALLSESHRAEEDIDRIVLVLALEYAGHIFFPQIVEWLRTVGAEPVFRYFGQVHVEAEVNHELVDGQIYDALGAIELSGEVRIRCRALVDRCFAAFSRLFDELERSVRAYSEPGGQRSLPRDRMIRQRVLMHASR